ncbi:hypothetical protein HK405_015587, partial [Cladochytrium tenue]
MPPAQEPRPSTVSPSRKRFATAAPSSEASGRASPGLWALIKEDSEEPVIRRGHRPARSLEELPDSENGRLVD